MEVGSELASGDSTGGEVSAGEAMGEDAGEGETDEGWATGRGDWQAAKSTNRHAIAPKIQAFRLLNIFPRLNPSHCRTQSILPIETFNRQRDVFSTMARVVVFISVPYST